MLLIDGKCTRPTEPSALGCRANPPSEPPALSFLVMNVASWSELSVVVNCILQQAFLQLCISRLQSQRLGTRMCQSLFVSSSQESAEFRSYQLGRCVGLLGRGEPERQVTRL